MKYLVFAERRFVLTQSSAARLSRADARRATARLRLAARARFAALAMGASALWFAHSTLANTEDDIVNGSTDLTASGSYTGGAPGTGSDVTFTATAYSPVAFTIGSTLSIGTLNDLSTTALSISGSGPLTLNGGANSVAPAGTNGGNAADLLFVATGGSLTITGTPVTLAASGNLDIAGTGVASLTGVVSSSTGLTKTGAGTLTLSGTNNYTGGTNVNAGLLAVTSDANLGSTAASNLITLNGGALQGGTSGASVNISANHGVVIGANGGTLTTNGGDNGNGIVFNTANTLSGSGNLTITGNNASGNNTILIGAAQNLMGSIFLEDRIQLTSATATLGTGTITIAGGTAIGTGTTFGTARNGQLFFTAGSGTTTLSNALFLNGNGNDNYGAIRGNNSQILNGNLTLQSNSTISDSGTNTTTINGTTTGAFTLNFGGVNGSSNSANYILNGADSASATAINNGSLTLGTSTAAQGTQLTGGSSGTVKFVTGVGTFFAGSLGGSEAIGLADTGGTAVTLSVGASQTYSGTLTGGAGSALTYTGSGEAHFAGTATGFTGAININTTGNGKLDLGTSLGSGGSVNVSSGSSVFVYQGTVANTIFNLNGGGNGENLGALRVDGGVIGATSTINLLANSTIGTNGGTQTIAGIIASTGGFGFTKQGGGTIVLSGANTFGGTTNMGGGGLTLSNALALQNSTLNYTGGTLAFDQSVTGNAFTLGALGGGANIALQNNATTPAAIAVSAGSNNANTTYTGVLSGGTGSSFTKTGTGTLTLGTAATLTGNFTIGNGTVALNGDNQVSAGPLILGTAGAANNTAFTFSQNGKTFANAISTQGTGGTNTIQSQGDGQGFTLTGGITLGNNLTLSTAGTDTITVQTGAVGGTGTLITTATAGGAVSGQNSAGGTITVNSAVGTAVSILNNGTSTSAVTYGGVISGTGSITQNSATSQLNISNTNTYSGGTNLLNGTIFSSIGGNASNTFGTGTFAFGTAGAANTTLLSISNGGKSYSNALTSTGNGGSNTIFTSGGGQTFTFTGATTLSSGASASTLVLSTGGTNGNNSDALSLSGGITGTGNVVTQSGDAGTTGAGAVTLSGATVNFAGTFTNSGTATSSSGTLVSAIIGTNVTGVVQNSAGSALTLSAANTYAGPTTVTSGLLTITSTGSINASNSVSVASTGMLTLGNAAALADAGTLSLVSGSTLTLGAANGTTETIGNLILNGNIEPAGTYNTTNFSTLTGSGGINFASTFGETLTVGAVPEPSTLLGGLLSCGLLGYHLRRRLSGLPGRLRKA